jgi:alanine dehydrogenase
MFKSVGSALQDIVAAELIFERAIAAGLAVTLPIQFSYKQ